MSLMRLEESKKLREQGKRLGRDGISQRINDLVFDFVKKYPNGNYRQAIILAGKIHALYLATSPTDYWREVADRGYNHELFTLKKFEKRVYEDEYDGPVVSPDPNTKYDF